MEFVVDVEINGGYWESFSQSNYAIVVTFHDGDAKDGMIPLGEGKDGETPVLHVNSHFAGTLSDGFFKVQDALISEAARTFERWFTGNAGREFCPGFEWAEDQWRTELLLGFQEALEKYVKLRMEGKSPKSVRNFEDWMTAFIQAPMDECGKGKLDSIKAFGELVHPQKPAVAVIDTTY